MDKLYQDFKNARVVFLFSILLGLLIGLTIVGHLAITETDVTDLHNMTRLLGEQNRILRYELLSVIKDIVGSP